MSEQARVLEILKIFSFDKKRELEVYCKGLTIHGEDLGNIILLAEFGHIEYRHLVYQRDIVPKHLRLSADDANGMTDDREKEEKFFRKAGQLFRERRYLMGHMFYSVEHQKWHFFYFDQRDTQNSTNHWRYGSHIHFLNYLWPEFSPRSIWETLRAGNPKIKRSLHIRFEDLQFSREG